MTNTDSKKIDNLLARGVEEIIDREHLRQKLLSGKVLRVKLGIDPTSPNLHIGRAIPLLKLRDFQELGHLAIFIIGDSTGVIGDASDKDSERPMLTPKQVTQNAVTYLQQAFKILNPKKTRVYRNSTWLKKVGYLELAKMASNFGLHEFITRESIAKRMSAGKRVSYLETMYPLLQGYDSVKVKADIEIGGTDQWFNLLVGRDLQRFYGQDPQDIIVGPLLEGTDGRKMSSSWGNTINLLDGADEMFGKVMSIPDELIAKYFILATRLPMEEVNNIAKLPNPRDQKARLAEEIVTMYHSKAAAKEAAEHFTAVFSRHESPEDMPVFVTDKKEYPLLDLLCDSGLATSKSEAKRVVEGGGVQINQQAIADWKRIITLENDAVIKFGKRKFVKITMR